MDSTLQKQLNERFRGFKTLPYLFVGSGFSRRYLGLDTWEQLLRRYAAMVSTDPMAYRVYEGNAQDLNSEYGVKPDIASLLERDFKKRWLNDLDIVLGVGVFKGFGIKGYESITSEEVHEDIVLHNLQAKYRLEPDYKRLILQHTLPRLLKRSKYIPVLEYTEGVSEESIPQEVRRCMDRTYDSFFTGQYAKYRGTKSYHSIEEIVSNASEPHKQLQKIGYLREEEVSVEELGKFLRSMLQEHGSEVWNIVGAYKSQLKALIQLYDWMIHKK